MLKILAEKGDFNIVTGPGVTEGRLSIHMKDVPVEQAVNLVVRAAGMAYERIGNSILVADAKITPIINPDGFITTQISPEVSAIDRFTRTASCRWSPRAKPARP